MSRSDVVAVIPARYQSSRFPGKPLAKIHGVPMVLLVFERVAKVVSAPQVLVATDDDRIAAVCAKAGVRAVMTPSNCLTGTDRICEAVRSLDARVIVNVQGDEPLIQPAAIQAVIEAKLKNPGAVINAMSRIADAEDARNPNVPKPVVNERGDLVYMSRAPIPFVKDSRFPAEYYRQVCIYAFDKEQLSAFGARRNKSRLEGPEDIEILRFLDIGIPVKMIEVEASSIAVDKPEDLARVEAMLTGGF